MAERTRDPAKELSRLGEGRHFTEPVAVFAAHPDDEVIGMGARLGRLREITFVHVTDGAPANMADAKRLGFATRACYAARREQEWAAALAAGGLKNPRRIAVGLVDQTAAHNLTELILHVGEILDRVGALTVVTHPYEGGHPDHDATALAVHAAVALKAAAGRPVRLVEFASYHLRAGRFRASEFLERPGVTVQEARLDAAERERKRRMLDCFQTQVDFLNRFPVRAEPFRLAPRYDFTRPPSDEPLFYEAFDWGVTRELWSRSAAEALLVFGLDGAL